VRGGEVLHHRPRSLFQVREGAAPDLQSLGGNLVGTVRAAHPVTAAGKETAVAGGLALLGLEKAAAHRAAQEGFHFRSHGAAPWSRNPIPKASTTTVALTASPIRVPRSFIVMRNWAIQGRNSVRVTEATSSWGRVSRWAFTMS